MLEQKKIVAQQLKEDRDYSQLKKFVEREEKDQKVIVQNIKKVKQKVNTMKSNFEERTQAIKQHKTYSRSERKEFEDKVKGMLTR